MQCKICGKDKIKQGAMIGTQYVYYYSDGKRWHGRICPKCVKSYAKKRRGTDRILDKECSECGKSFKTNRNDKLTCSTACSRSRRVKVEVERQNRVKRSRMD